MPVFSTAEGIHHALRGSVCPEAYLELPMKRLILVVVAVGLYAGAMAILSGNGMSKAREAVALHQQRVDAAIKADSEE